ncbi:MAG: TonB family protein [Acidobacteriaceae bacterium]
MAQTRGNWNRNDPFGNNLGGSLLLHVAVVGLLFGYALFNWHGKEWGQSSVTQGAIQASMVSAIPLPQTQPPSDNVLATETPSPAPALPEPKAAPKIPLDAIPIPDKKKPPQKVAEKPHPTPPKYTPPQLKPDRATYGETAGLHVAMSTVQTQNGTASMAVQNGDFGSRFAWYVNVVNRKVAQNWLRGEADPRTSNGRRTTVLFDITRDGSPTNVRIETPSGSPSLDASALHAVQRVNNFGPLPAGYNGSHITVEYYFDYVAH